MEKKYPGGRVSTNKVPGLEDGPQLKLNSDPDDLKIARQQFRKVASLALVGDLESKWQQLSFGKDQLSVIKDQG